MLHALIDLRNTDILLILLLFVSMSLQFSQRVGRFDVDECFKQLSVFSVNALYLLFSRAHVESFYIS